MTQVSLSPAPTRVRRLLATLKRHWSLVLLLVVAFGYSATVTLQHTEAFSPVDEWVYADYLYKMPEQGIVFEGEYAGDEALEILACEGTSPFGPYDAPCQEHYVDKSAFPNNGLTTASPYTPIYFALTRIVGDAIHIVTGLDQLTSWRLTGSLWLAASMFVLYLLMRQWKVRDHAIAALGLAFIASPFAWWTYTYVSTDAPSFLVGGLLLYLAVAYQRGQRSGWWLVAVSTLAVLIKVTNILALGLVGLYLVIQLIREARRTEWSGLSTRRPEHPNRYSLALLGIPVVSVTVAAAAEFGWLRLVSAWAVSDRRADQGVNTSLTGGELLSQFTNFLPNAITYSPIGSYLPGFVYAPLNWITVAAVVGAFWTIRARERSWSVVLPVTIAAAISAPLLAVTLQLVNGSYFQLPSRYGAPILAGFLLLGGLILRSRAGSWAVGLYATALLVVGVWLSGYLATLA